MYQILTKMLKNVKFSITNQTTFGFRFHFSTKSQTETPKFTNRTGPINLNTQNYPKLSSETKPSSMIIPSYRGTLGFVSEIRQERKRDRI